MTDTTTWLLESLLPWLVVGLIGCGLSAFILTVILNFLDKRSIAKQPSAFIELTPPANTDKTPEATKQLFAVLYGLEASRTFLDRVLRRKVVFSLEVVSTKQEGIRYLLRVPESDVANFEQAIISYLPE